MINAFFSSKIGGTKWFKRGAQLSTFGWDTIISMYQREVSRARQQLTRMVPRLKEVHCVRDAWMKLNVSPAKIMQVQWLYFIKLDYNVYILYSKNKYLVSYTNTSTKIRRHQIKLVPLRH